MGRPVGTLMVVPWGVPSTNHWSVVHFQTWEATKHWSAAHFQTWEATHHWSVAHFQTWEATNHWSVAHFQQNNKNPKQCRRVALKQPPRSVFFCNTLCVLVGFERTCWNVAPKPCLGNVFWNSSAESPEVVSRSAVQTSPCTRAHWSG